MPHHESNGPSVMIGNQQLSLTQQEGNSLNQEFPRQVHESDVSLSHHSKDEVSSLSGDFINAHRSPACRSFTSFQTAHTHTQPKLGWSSKPATQQSVQASKLHTTDQWVRVLPPEIVIAGPEEWRNTFR